MLYLKGLAIYYLLGFLVRMYVEDQSVRSRFVRGKIKYGEEDHGREQEEE